MINFRKKKLDSTKIPILKRSENSNKMHEFMHENMKKMQREGYKGLTGLGRGKPCKKNGRKRQKFEIEPWPSRMEREKVKNFLKKCLSQLKISFLKNFPYDFWLIEILSSIDRNKQRLTEIFKNNFDRSKNRLDQSKQTETHKIFDKNTVFKKVLETSQSIEI